MWWCGNSLTNTQTNRTESLFNTYSFGWDCEKTQRVKGRERKKGKSYILFGGLLSSYIDLLSDVQKPQTQNSLEFRIFFSQLLKVKKIPNIVVQNIFCLSLKYLWMWRAVFEFCYTHFCQQIILCEVVICLQAFFSVFEICCF